MPKHSLHRQRIQSGFTLVELSIILVIIALIAGGTLVGTNLLRAAKVQSIMTDKQRYEEAIENFKDKYKALPGDMANATDFWGAEDADQVTCEQIMTPSTDKTTCNGNGNERIFGDGSAGYRFHERFRFWQHLANAELIEGNYTGINNCDVDGVSCFEAGINAPTTEFRTATWAVIHSQGNIIGGPIPSDFFDETPSAGLVYDHVMFFGRKQFLPELPVLTPKEAWSLDKKFDDGLPASGMVMTLEPASGDGNDNCTTTADPLTAEYNLATSDIECMLLFRLSF